MRDAPYSSTQRYHTEQGKELITRAECVRPSAFGCVYRTAAVIITISNDPSWEYFHEVWPNFMDPFVDFFWVTGIPQSRPDPQI